MSGLRCLQRCHGQDSRSHCLRDTSGLFNRQSLCSDFDVADDVALLAEVFDTLNLALSVFEEEAAELGLHTNWLKTKVQSLSDFLPRPPNLTVQGGTVEVVEKFQYLGVLIHESCCSSLEIRRRIELARKCVRMLGEEHLEFPYCPQDESSVV